MSNEMSNEIQGDREIKIETKIENKNVSRIIPLNSSLSLSPIFSLSCGYIFTFSVIVILYFLGFYQDSDYFQWGPPVVFFSHNIETNKVFYILFTIIFLQQIVTNWIYEVIMPWIINTIQNPRNDTLNYSKKTCILIINANSLFSQIHLAFMVSSITSQISFLLCLILADFITLTYINWNYIKNKIEPERNIEMVEVNQVDSISSFGTTESKTESE